MYEIKKNVFVEGFYDIESFAEKIIELFINDKLDDIHSHGPVERFDIRDKMRLIFNETFTSKKGIAKARWAEIMKELNYPNYIIVYWFKLTDTEERLQARKKYHRQKYRERNGNN